MLRWNIFDWNIEALRNYLITEALSSISGRVQFSHHICSPTQSRSYRYQLLKMKISLFPFIFSVGNIPIKVFVLLINCITRRRLMTSKLLIIYFLLIYVYVILGYNFIYPYIICFKTILNKFVFAAKFTAVLMKSVYKNIHVELITSF